MDHELVLMAGAALAIMITASVFSRRTGVAAPLLLVALGIGTSYLPGTPTLNVDPEVVLAGILPLLLYASAVQLPMLDFRRNLSLISWLSVVLVIVSAVVIGLVVHAVFPDVDLAIAIALGAVVSPTDAVAATAIGRRVGLPGRVMAVLEGESLVNDAAALVVLGSATTVLTSRGGGAHFSLGHAVLEFCWAVACALVVGVVVGRLTTQLRQWLDDPVLNTTISFAVPFLAYFPAEELHGSGVLAVVAAGLTIGRLGPSRFSARDRQTQATTSGTIVFVLESGVFLLMGYELPAILSAAREESPDGRLIALVAVVLGLVVALRFLGVAWPALSDRTPRPGRTDQLKERLSQFEAHLEAFTPQDERDETRLRWARNRLGRRHADVAFERREPLTRRGYLVIGWAGMRGVVTVAAAQTLPRHAESRATVVFAAFMVALITLVLFGLTLPPLIRRLDFRVLTPEERRSDLVALTKQIGGAAIDQVGPLAEQRIDGDPIDPYVVEVLEDRLLPILAGTQQALQQAKPGMREQTLIIQRRYLGAMRDALDAERSIGAYRSETYKQLQTMLDQMEQRVDTTR